MPQVLLAIHFVWEIKHTSHVLGRVIEAKQFVSILVRFIKGLGSSINQTRSMRISHTLHMCVCVCGGGYLCGGCVCRGCVCGGYMCVEEKTGQT